MFETKDNTTKQKIFLPIKYYEGILEASNKAFSLVYRKHSENI